MDDELCDRPEPDHRSTAQPGAEFAYDFVRDRLTSALERLNRVDTNAGILAVALMAASGGFLAVQLNTLIRVVTVVPLIGGITLTTACLLLTRVERAPQPQAVIDVIDLAPEQIKMTLTPLLLDTYEVTTAQADRKDRIFRFAVAVVLVGSFTALVAATITG